MTLTELSSILALITLAIPATIATSWLIRPPHGRTRRGPALVVAVCAAAVGSHLAQLGGITSAGAFLRLLGTVLFAALAIELLDRAPRRHPT